MQRSETVEDYTMRRMRSGYKASVGLYLRDKVFGSGSNIETVFDGRDTLTPESFIAVAMLRRRPHDAFITGPRAPRKLHYVTYCVGIQHSTLERQQEEYLATITRK